MYKIILLPLLAGLIAQAAKLVFHTNGSGWRWRNLVKYSGMPSGHSALVSALAATTGLSEGLGSPDFAISLILAVIVIRDALGIRRYLGQHGKILNILVKDLKDDKVLDEHYPHLLEKIGHTPAQVAVGILIGLLVSFSGYFLL